MIHSFFLFYLDGWYAVDVQYKGIIAGLQPAARSLQPSHVRSAPWPEVQVNQTQLHKRQSQTNHDGSVVTNKGGAVNDETTASHYNILGINYF